VQARQSPSWIYLATWYVASACLLLLLPAARFGLPIWRLPRSQWIPFTFLAIAFVVSAGIATLFRSSGRWRVLCLTSLFTIASFGIVFFVFILARIDSAHFITVSMFLCAAVLIPAPYVVGSFWVYRAAALSGLLAAMVALPFAIAIPKASQKTSALTKSEYYNLRVETYSGAFSHSPVHGGALARIGDRYLLLTGDGHLNVFGLDNGTDGLKVTPLPYRVPINGNEFAAAAGRPWADMPGEWGQLEALKVKPENEFLNTEWFRTYGLLVQAAGPELRVFVSHDYWHSAQQCWVERVSMLKSDLNSFLQGTAGSDWKTLYETTPCLPVHGEGRRHNNPFIGFFGGGRMAMLDAHTLLLTVGDFGFDGVDSLEALPQNPAASYGKTITINIDDGHATLFTLGNRNPQGLFIDRSGIIWSTEHGPQGGDELNQLERGKNYGWPYATYGTQYGALSWPLNKPEAESSYQTPVFAWVPSIGVSNLLAVEGELFPEWRGDLLIASLKGQTLFRARFRQGHVVYLEPIGIGSRIRDLIEGHDGRIILWTDDDTLVSLRPNEGTSGEAMFEEKCSGCHTTEPTGANTIGPNLKGVFGRRIASLGDYPNYSPALRKSGGAWTEERLDAFLKAPSEACPGTAMDYAGVANSGERAAIINYLGTLK
jgi:aldose sugar dehydrogenase